MGCCPVHSQLAIQCTQLNSVHLTPSSENTPFLVCWRCEGAVTWPLRINGDVWRTSVLQILFFQSVACLFSLLMVCFDELKLSIFIMSNAKLNFKQLEKEEFYLKVWTAFLSLL